MMTTIVQRVTWFDQVCCMQLSRSRGTRAPFYVFRILSASADGYWYPLLLIPILFQAPERAVQFVSVAAVAFAVELPLYLVIKSLTRRCRPCDVAGMGAAAVQPPDRYSFPSGHTAAACVMARVIAVLFPVCAPVAWVWAVLVGLSRIYLGVHYPTDVLAGCVLGGMSATVALWLI